MKILFKKMEGKQYAIFRKEDKSILFLIVMEEIQQFVQKECERLKRIKVDKVYYRHMMEAPEVCIIFKDEDYMKDVENDYEVLFDELNKLDIDPSVVPMNVWQKRGSQKWGWKEIQLY